MGRRLASLLVLACTAGAAAQARAQCPVLLQRISLTYSHDGGKSMPQLQIKFANVTAVKLEAVTFQLSVQDVGGSPQIYPEDLKFSDGLTARKSRVFSWDLEPDAVDIHRTGETVVVRNAEFSDGSRWKDDGSESCRMTVDFQAR